MKTRPFSFLTAIILFTGALYAQPPKQPSVEERLKHVTEKIGKEITLTASQKEKITSAYKAFFASMEKMRANSSKEQAPPPPGNMEEIKKLSRLRDEKIKAVLSAAQYVKYAEIEKSLRPPMPGKQAPPPEKEKQ